MGDLVSTSFMVLLLYTWCCESAGTSDLPNEAINEQLLTTRTKFGNLDKHFSGLGAEALYFWPLMITGDCPRFPCISKSSVDQ